MQRQLTFYLLVLFAVYIIANDATGSGDLANSFFDWLGDGLDKTRTFVNATLGDDSTATAG
ncbi:MAG: hypothetical protein AAF567_05690 [Actinomycetota bacterium]